jgi:serine/threonine protein kinase/tetratricopeptide (TPR) repeat protein
MMASTETAVPNPERPASTARPSTAKPPVAAPAEEEFVPVEVVEPVATDRNLLFGVLALQAALIDKDQFAEVCATWIMRKHVPLADLLAERRLLTSAERQEVERLVQRHLKKHSGNVRASLAEVADARVRETLAELQDDEVQHSLAELSHDSHRLLTTVSYKPSTRDRYTLTRLHAKGGIGQVWLAQDDDLHREIALKELLPNRAGDPLSWRRFVEEAQITGQLEHPGIVPVYELVKPGDKQLAFYTMRFIRGRTLKEAGRHFHKRRIKGKTQSLEQLQLLNAFVSICNAVAYAHSRGVIHRDLKGQNIILGDFGEVIVLDWGLAKLLDQPAGESELPPIAIESDREDTLQGEVLGTPAYMAPEQARGRSEQLDERTDVYGLGTILYEILTGQPPFSGADTQEVLRRVQSEEPDRPRQLVATVPPALEAICLKAISKRPQDRYDSAGALATDVQHWLADEPVTAYPEAPHRRLARWCRRHPSLVTAAALLLLAFAAGGVWFQLDRAARAAAAAQALAKTEGQVLAALDDTTRLILQGHLDGAHAAVERAQDQLAGGSTDLQNRVRQARDDLGMLQHLENVLLLETFTAGKFENAAANAAYAVAFQSYGVNVETLDPKEAAQRIKESAIREQLVTALDDWIYVRARSDTSGRDRLLNVVRLADSDAWRQRLRDPVMHKDRAALQDLAKRPEAVNQPPTILVHLGKYLAQAGAFASSVEVLRRAQRQYPSDFWVNYALGMALSEQDPPQLEQAIGFFRAAVALRPDSRVAHLSLGRQLLRYQQTAEALVQFKRADELIGPREGNSVQVLIALGVRLLQQGKYADAARHFKAADELLPPNDPLKQALAVDTKNAERLRDLDEKLPAILRGDVKLANNVEKLLVASICQQSRQLYAASARLYFEAFSAEPNLANDMQHQYRYNAACAAALAGCGQGTDAVQLDARQRSVWRKCALEWLRADLAQWTVMGKDSRPNARFQVQQILTHWRTDTDLAGIRDAEQLAKLPPEERDALQMLWDEVTILLKNTTVGN